MARLWRHDGNEWATIGIEDLAADAAVILRSDDAAGGAWLLVAAGTAGVAINGDRVAVGVAVLADRDEILLADGTRLFFSAASAAVIERFATPPADLRCPRCRRAFAPATPVVRCPAPGCGVVHHQTDDLPCFTYADRCAVCPQPTQIDAAAGGWTPEEL
jgi:hypothetical protein